MTGEYRTGYRGNDAYGRGGGKYGADTNQPVTPLTAWRTEPSVVSRKMAVLPTTGLIAKSLSSAVLRPGSDNTFVATPSLPTTAGSTEGPSSASRIEYAPVLAFSNPCWQDSAVRGDELIDLVARTRVDDELARIRPLFDCRSVPGPAEARERQSVPTNESHRDGALVDAQEATAVDGDRGGSRAAVADRDVLAPDSLEVQTRAARWTWSRCRTTPSRGRTPRSRPRSIRGSRCRSPR
jgi:hypothetical protein